MPREFFYRGKGLEELKKLSLKEFAALLPARERRTLTRGFTSAAKSLLKSIEAGEKNLRTHARELIILPSMVGLTIGVYNGKEFTPVTISPEMIGHRLGEFALTRKKVVHSAPGIGATRSSASLSVR
ncbi:MAG: 30S ribosomal protein S19 [Candidatus Woesearchaeota archaeon]